MSIALGNFNGIHTPVQRIQEDSNLRMLLIICGSIAAPSLVLAVFLSGWLQYLLVFVIAINIAVPVTAYLISLTPPCAPPDEDLSAQRRIPLEEATLPLKDRVPAEKVPDKV